MDPTTAVRTDTLPAVATLIAPGALAGGAYVWFGISTVPSAGAFLEAHETFTTVLSILLLIVIGMIVESLGSYVEVFIDRRRPDHKKMIKTWWKYLRLAWTHEPIGQRYLRRLLVSFKFELNMCTAALLAIPGVLLLGYRSYISLHTFFWLLLVLAVSATVFFLAAKDSADVLAKVRTELTKGVLQK